MRKTSLMILGWLLTLSACAGDIDKAPASPLKVDLGNVVETGTVTPVDGITPAGQPDEAALRVFAESGYAAVIDLRTAGEDRGLDERSVVERLDMDYVPLPVGRGGITFENASALDELIKRYDEPVLIHCGSSNRVGALLALRASMQGAEDQVAIEIGRKAGLTGLESQVKQALSQK